MTVVVATAGHIDHGKTALLRALTGIDADRLPEERRRGMTIDVGYAHLQLPDGSDLDFVDVPGHDRLVGNMLVGAGEVEAALLVIAADDGPRAQTIEHLELLDALRINDAIVVLTKIDAVEPGRVAVVIGLIRGLLAGTSLEGSPIVPVSTIDGRGLAGLVDALGRLRNRVLEHAPRAASDEPVRLAIDRSFLIKGRGAVVTGSLRGGRLERGAQLRLVPGERLIRARELQVHGKPVDAVAGGGRVALNLAGIDVADLPRGAVLTTDPAVGASPALIAVLRPRSAIERPAQVAPGAVFRLHLGTEQVQATLGRGRLDLVPLPGGGVVARLRLGRSIAIAAGDRFVLRPSAPGSAAIGGVVLDPDPPVGPSRRRAGLDRLVDLGSADPVERSRALVGLHGVLDPGRLPNGPGGGSRPERGAEDAPTFGAIMLGGRLVAAEIAGELEATALGAVADRARPGTPAPSISRAELRTVLVHAIRRLASLDARVAGPIVDDLLANLVTAGRLGRDGDQLHEPGRRAVASPALAAAMDHLERLLAVAAPPPLAQAMAASGCPPDGLRALESTGRIIRLDDDLAYTAPAYRELARMAVRMAEASALTPAAYRDATGTSRKFVMAILEDLDRRGVLRRAAAGHLPGARAGLVDEIGRIGP